MSHFRDIRIDIHSFTLQFNKNVKRISFFRELETKALTEKLNQMYISSKNMVLHGMEIADNKIESIH